MPFTDVNHNSTSAVPSVNTIPITVTGVHAGDLVWVWAGDDGSQAVNSVSDGTTTFAALTGVAQGAANGRLFYLLASVASGTVTYTATFAAACVDRFIGVWVFTPSAACVFDQANTGASAGTTIDSGNITTTGSDELVVAGDLNNAGVHSSLQIGGVAATLTDSDGIGAFWYRATTGTVKATGTATGAGRTVTAIASFKIASAVLTPDKWLTPMDRPSVIQRDVITY